MPTNTPVPLPLPAQGINLQAPTGPGINFYQSLQSLFNNAVVLVFMVAAVLVFIMLLWGGLEWIMSGGDKEKVGNARKRIVNALVGLAILALAFLIMNVMGQIIGFQILGKPFNIPTPNSVQ